MSSARSAPPMPLASPTPNMSVDISITAPTPTSEDMATPVSPSARPRMQHHRLGTTFVGVDHQLSTVTAPIAQYRGIRYASYPARFRPSKLVAAYPPEVDATRFGPVCPQFRPVFAAPPTPFAPTSPVTPGSAKNTPSPSLRGVDALTQDEFECLNLNVTCPRNASPAAPLPVMVWVHGGDSQGAGSSWVYDAGSLVNKSISMRHPTIVVTLNYRLGLFGNAASPALRTDNEEAGDSGVGNYGLRDQQVAFEWVHRFIGGFGGDPERVTLFGEGTGATDILRHLRSAANEREPHFFRAIVQSPVGCSTSEVSTVHSAGYALSKIISTLHLSGLGLEALRAVDQAELATVSHRYGVRAVDDGVFFCRGWKTTPTEAAPYQPVIIGDNSLAPLAHSTAVSGWSSPTLTRRVKAITQSLARASSLLRAYDVSASTTDWDMPDRLMDLLGDARYSYPADRAARRLQVSAMGQVYRYVWDQDAPPPGAAINPDLEGLPSDLAYLFDNGPAPPPPPAHGSPYDTAVFEDLDDADLEDLLDAQSPGSLGSSGRSDSTTSCLSLWSAPPPVDAYAYAHVRDAVQGRWLAFAGGEVPWDKDKVFVFGPEGECGPRSMSVFEGRRRVKVWQDAFEPLGMDVVQKVGMELANGPTA